MKTFAKYIFFGIFLLFINSSFADESASNNTYKDVANEIYMEVFSPFCPGRALKDCPSSKAEKLKVEILEQLNNGQSKTEVLNNVFSKYGEKYRALPKISGFSGLAWIIPILFLGIGLIFILLITLSKKSKNNNEDKSNINEDSFGDIDKLL